MNRRLAPLVALLAVMAVAIPSPAAAQRPDRSDRVCERAPDSPQCQRAEEIDDRRDAARCDSEAKAVKRAKKAVKRAKAKLRAAKESGGDVAKAQKKLKKKKAALKAAKAKNRACRG